MSKSRDTGKVRKFRDYEAVSLFLRGGREQPFKDRRKDQRAKACRKWNPSQED